MSTRCGRIWTPGSGRSSIALATAKMVVLAPMPIATDRMAVAAKSGDRRIKRSAYRTS